MFRVFDERAAMSLLEKMCAIIKPAYKTINKTILDVMLMPDALPEAASLKKNSFTKMNATAAAGMPESAPDVFSFSTIR